MLCMHQMLIPLLIGQLAAVTADPLSLKFFLKDDKLAENDVVRGNLVTIDVNFRGPNCQDFSGLEELDSNGNHRVVDVHSLEVHFGDPTSTALPMTLRDGSEFRPGSGTMVRMLDENSHVYCNGDVKYMNFYSNVAESTADPNIVLHDPFKVFPDIPNSIVGGLTELIPYYVVDY